MSSIAAVNFLILLVLVFIRLSMGAQVKAQKRQADALEKIARALEESRRGE